MAENNWAIVIGINEYEFLPADDHLKYADNDALKVQQFLCEQAKFPQDNVLLCCDSSPGGVPKKRPNRTGLRDLLKNEIQKAKGADNFWFFYAGHGIVHEHQDFLLPCDGNPRDLEQTAILISFVTDCLRDCGAANVVLVLDMCRNRTRGTDEGSRDIGEVMGEQTQQIAKEQGIVTLFSCSRGGRSYEIKDLKQGAFTYALLEGLKQSTTPRALEQYLTNRLPALNRQYGKPIQAPMVIPEPGWKYDRPLLLSCATPTDIQQLAVEARDAELEEQDYEKAKALWRQVIEADRSTPSDRRKALNAIERINNSIRKEETERQLEPEKQQKLEQQPQQQLKQEAEERQRREAEQLKQKQAEAERLNQEELERQRVLEQQQQELASEKGINYTKLRDLLKAQDWKAADQETADRMCEVMGRQEAGWLRVKDVQNFPCQDLRTIDQLWVKYSNGHFGFSVQTKIWQECGSPTSSGKDWDRFCVKVGWLTPGATGYDATDYVDYSDLKFDLKNFSAGEMLWDVVNTGVGSPKVSILVRSGCSLLSRAATCRL